MGTKIYAIVSVDNDFKVSFAEDSLPKKVSGVTLVADTHRAIVRVVKLTKADKKLTPKIKWRLVQENFPLGILLSEETHYFDGRVFTNGEGEHCFLMVALPKNISQAIADIAVEKFESIHKISRLDTIEHLMFAYYARKTEKPHAQWIIYPQDEGFRILHMEAGMPCGAYYMSNRVDMREAELGRVWEVAVPDNVVILRRESFADGLWIEEFVQSRGDAIITCEAIPNLTAIAMH
ncbi:MAG: hypothetical protein FWC73_10375 [Defluviitaleaceae bacterium]|nr:hypothetical protein [Defluviitaleaceae bacterium]